MTMRAFPLPSDIVAKGARDVLAHWKTEVKRGVGILKRAEKLLAAATASIGLTDVLLAARLELSTLLGQFDLFSEQLEAIMKQVMQILEDIPGTAHMLTVPGVGAITVAGFLADVGDLNNYDHGLQIIRLAGLNFTENSSGKRKGKTGISKRGRSRLRALLFRAVMPMVAKNEAFMHSTSITRHEVRIPLRRSNPSSHYVGN